MEGKKYRTREKDGGRAKVLSFSAGAALVAEIEAVAASRGVSTSRVVDSLLRSGLAADRRDAEDAAVVSDLRKVLSDLRVAGEGLRALAWTPISAPVNAGNALADLGAEIVVLAAAVATYGQHPVTSVLAADAFSPGVPIHRVMWVAMSGSVASLIGEKDEPLAVVGRVIADQARRAGVEMPPKAAYDIYLANLTMMWPSVEPLLRRAVASMVEAAISGWSDAKPVIRALPDVELANLQMYLAREAQARAALGPSSIDDPGD